MAKPPYRHVIWDWNGTLLDDLDLSIDVMNGLLGRRRLPRLDRTRYHALFDFPVQHYYERLGFDPAVDRFERLSAEFISAYDARRFDCALHGGVTELLTSVAQAGLGQSILSAYRGETLREVVAHFGLAAHFTHVDGLDNIHARSKAALGHALVARLGLPPRELLLVGDTLHDFDVAQELGVDCILVSAGHHPAERLRRVTARVHPDLHALAAEMNLTTDPALRSKPRAVPPRAVAESG